MRSRVLILGFAAFTAAFAAALWWAQTRAYYERVDGVTSIDVQGRDLPVTDYDGIDASTSPLKMRGCFRVAGGAAADALSGVETAAEASPLVAPDWFDCYDAEAIAADLAAARARAILAGRDQPEGFDRMIAVYPDGRGFIWRQLNEKFAD